MDIRQEEEKASQARLSSELRFSSIFIDPWTYRSFFYSRAISAVAYQRLPLFF
jgi:hypothetical protein